jgi:hypothetical protein
MPLGSYQYKALDPETPSVRLVTIKPSVDSKRIECEIDIHALDQLPVYEALSYAWGDQTSRDIIHVDGSVLHVTTNLYSALQCLRLDTPRLMWIDAICVNQDDLEERSSQVQLMRHIYQNAVQVVAYLGESTPASNAAFELVRSAKLKDWFTDESDEAATQAEENRICKILLSKSSRQGFIGLSQDIAIRPWFQRVWVIQEVAVSKKVILQCGHATLPFGEYVSLVSCIASLRQRLPTDGDFDDETVRRTADMAETRFQFQNSHSLSIAELVHRYRGRGATDPRDNVYALLGLATDIDTGDALSNPNYDQTVTKMAVYVMVMEHYIRTYQRLDLICEQRRYDLPRDWPSWLPDWSATGKPAPGNYSFALLEDFVKSSCLTTKPLIEDFIASRESLKWAASGNVVAEASILNAPPTLLAKGITIDTIYDLGKSYTIGGNMWSQIDWITCRFREWETTFLRNFGNQRVPGGCTVFDVTDQCFKLYKAANPANQEANLAILQRVFLYLPWPFSWYRARARENLAKEFSQGSILKGNASQRDGTEENGEGGYVGGGNVVDAYLNTLFHDTFFDSVRGDAEARRLFWTSSAWPSAFQEDRDRFESSIIKLRMHVLHRQFLVTGRGYMGTATYNARKDDIVAVLYGCSVPVILRKVGDDYVFIGECYVQGLMDGEAMGMAVGQKFEERDFVLI